ncbi:Cytochrome P450 2U1 [Hypsibius exemplaris]|uniref:Cytochrome P450 2U1 n=1 Tax=Hypsibius exemplaris TaxID=2072580 RepID=A0A1W0WBN7_HYPEX|nr:Cytochrome P450 2U1 [Hypsibius exemplaris]
MPYFRFQPSLLTSMLSLESFNSPVLLSFVVLILLSVRTFFWYNRRPKGAPPGPVGLPFVGSAPFLLHNAHLKFQELGKIYGNVFTVYLGNRLTVVLNDFDAIKAAYVDKSAAFASRRPGFVNGVTNGWRKDGKARGIGMTSGHQWQTIRKFNMTALRNLGIGKMRTQTLILDEVQYFSDKLERGYGRPMEALPMVRSAIVNILCMVMLGFHPAPNDRRVDAINSFLDQAHMVVKGVEPLQIFPWLRLLPGKYKAIVNKYRTTVATLGKMFRREIEVHDQLSLDADGSRDYIEAFQWQRAKDLEENGEDTYFDEPELIAQLNNLFGAGTMPTTATLAWALYFMVQQPEAQQKLYQELDKVIGTGRWIETSDKGSLPFVEAICRETHRLGSVLPLGAPRCTTEDVELLGYCIPQGTAVLPNLYNINRDPLYWKNPNEFRPERFFDANGQLFNPPYFIPFSTGLRQCPGQAFVTDVIFLFFANLMNRFQVSLPRGTTLATMEQSIGDAVLEPPTFELVFTPRRFDIGLSFFRRASLLPM